MNLGNMFALINLRCLNLVIPLDNHYRPSAEKIEERRTKARARRQKRQEAKKKALETKTSSGEAGDVGEPPTDT